MARDAILQIRRETESNWTTINPVLRAGEFGYEVDSNRLKVGNGSTPWVDLEYVTGGGSGLSTVSESPPPEPQTGNVWFNSSNGITYIYYDSYWIEIGGVTGQDGISIGPTAPSNTDVLWYDTTESGDAVVPVGGVTNQLLAKNSDIDYDLKWTTIPTIDFSDGNNIIGVQVFS